MKKFYFLIIATIVACFSVSAGKVYFTNPNGWTKVNCYFWGGSASACTWPGNPATQEGDLWVYDIPGTPTNVIFNNGSQQTGDLVYKEGATYDMKGIVGEVLPKWTVNFDNTKSGWSAVYCYTYNGNCTGSWPGTAMVAGENNMYTITFEAAVAPNNVIFTDNTGNQTADLEFVNGSTYDMNGITGVENDYAVMFQNSDNWEEVYAYAWSGSVPMVEYPGTKLENDGSGIFTYTFTASQAPQFIIFNNGKSGDDELKTPDFPFEDGKLYTMPGSKTLYIVGDLTNWAQGAEFTKDGGIYTLSVDGQIEGAFKLYDGTWDYNFGSGLDLTTDPEATLPADTECDAWFNGSNFVFAPATLADGQTVAKTNITFSYVYGSDEAYSSVPSTIVLTYELASGVEIVAEEEAPAVYYNLQGVKVENPSNGVFIQVRGNKASKVVIR